ncbi:MAG: hypothetical protein CL572_05865 [Alphaproteobacteria bacterium]|nr:hypothetical protein [Alphaproteobacteria bacterium]
MAAEKKQEPQRGDFIDLEKTEFKKKFNFFGFLIKYILLGVIFFGLGLFVSHKYKIPLDFNTNNVSNKKLENDAYSEVRQKVDLLRDDIEKLTKKIRDSNLSYENLEKKNRDLIIKLNDVSDRVSKVDEFNYARNFRKELDQYELLKNFIILKNKFASRQVLENEVSKISSFFEGNFQALTLLNFFNENDLPKIVRKDYLLDEINKKINKYDLQLEDFFEEVKNRDDLKRNNIFESKEQFFNYINDILSSTFKITKYDNTNFEENIRESGNYKEVLIHSKEYLIIGNVSKAVKIIEQSGVDLANFGDWLEKGNQLVEAKNKIENLEELILKKLVNYND